MKITLRNLMKPNSDNTPLYFHFLPYASLVIDKNGTHYYFGWFNICLAILKKK